MDETIELTNRYRDRHQGWNAKHFYSWYRRDGGKVDKSKPTQVGQAMKRLGIEMIAA